MNSLFAELKRRNVYKVAVAYAVVAWLLIQAASILFPTFEAPAWVMKVFVALIAAGFPIALVIAWAFEMTPEGMKRTENVPPGATLPEWSKRKFAALIITIGGIAGALLALQLLRSKPQSFKPNQLQASKVPDKSVAVLPFENLSEDKANAYFADGIQEEILTRLAKIADLKVISRTSTQQYQSKPGNLSEIARQLGVANVVEGSVQKFEDQVRVNVQLIHAQTDSHLWADTYDRKLTDIFGVESEIAKTIADTLRVRLTGSEAAAIAVRPTENPEAHELYLKGRFFWNKRTEADLRRGLEYFQQAIEKDPNYARAYAGIADSYDVLYFHSVKPLSAAEAFPPAKAAALKALELDESLAEAHAALAKALFEYYWDFAGAEKEFRQAIELNPNYATAHQWNCEFLSALGRLDEAKVEIERARELDPLSMIINAMRGLRYYWARQYPEAVAAIRSALIIDPNFPAAHSYLGDTYEALGDYENAIAERAQADVLYGRETPDSAGKRSAVLKHAYAQDGVRGYWQKTLDFAVQEPDAAQNYAYELAAIYAHLGNKEKAFGLLGRAYEQRNEASSLLHLNDESVWDNMRSDPRFRDLVSRTGVKQSGAR